MDNPDPRLANSAGINRGLIAPTFAFSHQLQSRPISRSWPTGIASHTFRVWSAVRKVGLGRRAALGPLQEIGERVR